jgi:hypothetical protein
LYQAPFGANFFDINSYIGQKLKASSKLSEEKVLFHQITNSIELGLIIGAVVVGYKAYQKSTKAGKIIQDVNSRTIQLASQTLDAIDSLDLTPKVNYTIDTERLLSDLSKSHASLKVLTFDSQERISITRTGRSKYLVTSGEAQFDFEIGFFGYVEYPCSQISISTLDEVILAKGGVPKIVISDVKITLVGEHGNLHRQSDIKFDTLQSLDTQTCYPYYLGAFLNGVNDGVSIKSKMLTDAYDSLNETLPAIITATAASINDAVNYEVMLGQNETQVQSLFVRTKLGEKEFSFAQIETATTDLILEQFASDPVAVSISIKELIGRLTKTKPTIQPA